VGRFRRGELASKPSCLADGSSAEYNLATLSTTSTKMDGRPSTDRLVGAALSSSMKGIEDECQALSTTLFQISCLSAVES